MAIAKTFCRESICIARWTRTPGDRNTCVYETTLRRNSQNTWVFAGDLVYTHENLVGTNPKDPEYIPIGFAMGSQANLVMTTEAMVKHVGGDYTHVVPLHEERLKDFFPSRLTKDGLRIVELALADGETSKVA